MTADPDPLTWALCISTLNRIDILGLCVDHALAQTRVPVEIVIVDASTDWQANRDRIALRVQASGIPLHYLPAPKRSLPAQRNCAIAAATADILFLIDDDALLYPDCADQILRVYEADPDHRIAAVSATDAPMQPTGGPTTAAKPKSAIAAPARSALLRFVWREVLLMSADRLFIPYDGGWHRPDPAATAHLPPAQVHPLTMISGYRLTVRRAVALREPFDGDLLAYAAAEDLDASYRFSRHGTNVAAVNARLYHHEAASGRLKRREATMLSVLNVAFLVRKHSDHPVRHAARFYLMVLRRLLAECLKDLASKRWDVPQLRGVIRSCLLSVGIFRQNRATLVPFYDALQRRVLGMPASGAP